MKSPPFGSSSSRCSHDQVKVAPMPPSVPPISERWGTTSPHAIRFHLSRPSGHDKHTLKYDIRVLIVHPSCSKNLHVDGYQAASSAVNARWRFTLNPCGKVDTDVNSCANSGASLQQSSVRSRKATPRYDFVTPLSSSHRGNKRSRKVSKSDAPQITIYTSRTKTH